jgi:hypothetical protein
VALDRVDFSAVQYVRFAIVKLPFDNKEDLVGEISSFAPPEHIAQNRCKNGFLYKMVQERITKVDCNNNPQEVLFKAKIVKLPTPQMPTDEFYKMSEATLNEAESLIQFVRINDIIKAARVRLVSNANGILESLKNRRKEIELGQINADFSIDMKTYNCLVKNIMMAKQITRETILECVNLAEVRTNGVDYEDFLIPIVTSALRKALTTESRLSQLLDSKLVKALNQVKIAGVKKVTLFDKFIQFVFGKVTINSFQ